MSKLVELNCRNFRCDSNEAGDCLQSNVQLTSVTGEEGFVDRLRCVQATEKEQKDIKDEDQKET